MSLFICCLWWFVLGVLVGWLLSWLLNRLFGRSRGPGDSARPLLPQPAAAAPRADDLTRIEGIGPKIAELLRGNGIDSFVTLSRADVAKLWSILDKGGTRFRLANPGTWPAQAEYAVRGDWAGLKAIRTSSTSASSSTGTSRRRSLSTWRRRRRRAST